MNQISVGKYKLICFTDMGAKLMTRLSKALEGTNAEEIKEKTEKLTEQFHTISQKLYQKAQEAQAGAGAAGFDPNNMAGGMGGSAGAANDAPKHDNVVDADYEVVDDNK